MSTSIDIASNALLLIGDNPISSFTEPGAGATAAANLYQITKESVLAEHPWTFALKEQRLNRLSQTMDTLLQYDKAYQLPPGLIRLWALFPMSDYTIVGNRLYSNQTELLARYVYDVSETLMPPHITKALEYKLASEFAVTVTESQSMSEAFEKKYLSALARARNIDSQGKPQVAIQDSPFTSVRYGGAR